MSMNEKFLSLYKEYETMLRAEGTEPKDREDVLVESGDVKGDRLRMCRLFRNYLSHVNDGTFLDVSKKMMSFMESEVWDLKMKGDVVRKHLKKPDVCMCGPNTKCDLLKTQFQSLKCIWMPIIYDDGSIAVLDIFTVLPQKAACKAGVLKGTGKNLSFCTLTDDYMSLDRSRVWICTDDGTEHGKVLGRVWFKDAQM